MVDFYCDLLKQHLVYEFTHGRFNRDIIFEVRSIVPNIDYIVNTVTTAVQKQINTTIEKGYETTRIYTEKSFEIKNCFFNEFYFEVTFKIGDKPTYPGGFAPIESFIYSNKKKGYIFRPYIIIAITSNNFDDFCNKFKFSIAHELTHAYGFYQYCIEHGKPQSKDEILSYGLLKQQSAMNSGLNFKSMIGILHYKLSFKELNAFLGQLRQELINNKDNIKDSQSAFNIIKDTNSYTKVFQDNKQKIEELCSITDETNQQLIIKYTNQVANKKFTTYNQIVKYYQTKWYKWSKLYLTKASKIAYDVFDEYGPIFT